MLVAEFLAKKGLAREVVARSYPETTPCNHAPNPLFPDITQVYTSAI